MADGVSVGITDGVCDGVIIYGDTDGFAVGATEDTAVILGCV